MVGAILLAMAAATQAPSAADGAPANAAIDVVAAQETQPAVLINRGVTLAMQGREAEARALFEEVRRTKVDYTLETRDGRWVYPPDLARAALKSLDRGEFRTASLALRD